MRLIIFLLPVLAPAFNLVFGQESFHGELLLLEEKIFRSSGDSEKASLVLRKMEICVASHDYSEDALNEAKRIDYNLLPDSGQQKTFLWNAALLSFLNDQRARANHYLDLLQSFPGAEDESLLLLGALVNNGYDTAQVGKNVRELVKKDTSFSALLCLNEVTGYQRKGKLFYIFSSALVPGTGSMFNGNVLKGFVSLLLTAATGAGIYLLAAHQLYFNAILFGGPIWMKFYTGNIRLTKKLFEKKERERKNKLAKKCELLMGSVLIKYPLTFRD